MTIVSVNSQEREGLSSYEGHRYKGNVDTSYNSDAVYPLGLKVTTLASIRVGWI